MNPKLVDNDSEQTRKRKLAEEEEEVVIVEWFTDGYSDGSQSYVIPRHVISQEEIKLLTRFNGKFPHEEINDEKDRQAWAPIEACIWGTDDSKAKWGIYGRPLFDKHPTLKPNQLCRYIFRFGAMA